MALESRQAALRDNYDALLLAYAAGLLDEAQQLIVAAHMMLAPSARRMVHMCEALGGALIHSGCPPVQMKRNSLENVLSQLEAPPVRPQPEPDSRSLPDEIGFIAPLLDKGSCTLRHHAWQRFSTDLHTLDLPLSCRSHARCLKAAPSAKMPHDRQGEVEITLVIQGSMEGECGHYRRGDLVVIDQAARKHTACPNTGGVYMIVNSAPSRTKGLRNWLDLLLR